MKELYDLVLKTINDSGKLGIFYSYYNSGTLTENPLDSYSGRGMYSDMYLGKLEQYSFFDFMFKFEDGNPDVRVKFAEVVTSETKKIETSEGPWWSRKTVEKEMPYKCFPTYKISAGELSYVTTTEESKELHAAYVRLCDRDKQAKINTQKKQIFDRLEGKVKLKTEKK